MQNFSHASTNFEEKKDSYVLLFNHDIDYNLLDSLHITVEQEFSIIPSASINATPEQVELLKASNELKSIQKEKTIKVNNQQIPWGFSDMKITPEVQKTYTGKNVNIGILDTGIDSSHLDLKVAGGVCVLDECSNGYNDDHGHGTHVAGIIGAKDNDEGIVGLAPSANLYAIKALDSLGRGTTTSIMTGIQWAIEHQINILNLSISTPTNDPAMEAMIDKAYQSGMLLVAAAGNDGTDNADSDTIEYPAKYPSVIAVGAINSNLSRSSFSGSGEELEFVAPGENILSTIPRKLDFDGTIDGYTTMSGTSMAAPYVTGLLALYKQAYPGYTNIQIRNLVQKNTKDIGATGKDPLYGYGIPYFSANTDIQNDSGENVVTVLTAENGQVHFDVKPDTNDKLVSVYRDGTKISLNQDNMDFVKAGNYHYSFIFEMSNGTKTKVEKDVQMDKPVVKDVTASNWYSEQMIYLFHQHILQGNNGYFKPGNKISRGEAVALVGRSLNWKGALTKTSFKDVGSSYFASGYIEEAYKRGILKGYKDHTFRPNEPVTRAEMAILISNAFNLEKGNTKVKFSDVSQNVTGNEQIYKLANAGITVGYPDKTFKPYNPITRAEFSVFLARELNPNFLE